MKTRLYPTSNDIRLQTRRAMIELLNQQLADVIDLGLQAKQAHWNVKGPNFLGLHQLFDKVAADLGEFSDNIAEHAVVLGGVAVGTVQVVSKRSRLSVYPTDLVSGQQHVTALSGALAKFSASTRDAMNLATKAGDTETADLFTEVSRGVGKLLWPLQAHLQAKD